MHRIRFFPLVVLFTPLAWGAGGTLVLSSGAVLGSTASLSLILASAGSQPAGIQWTLTYPTGNILSVSASAATASKTVSCAGTAGTYTCILVGRNATKIPDGVVASVSVTLAPGVHAASIGLTNTHAASFDGQVLSLAGVGGVVVSADVTLPPSTNVPPPTLTGLSCTASTLAPGAASTCTVTVSKTGGGTVTLASNNILLSVPPSVNVGASSTTATFTASAGSFTGDRTATVTATMGSATLTASIALSAPMTISALTCTPSSLNSGAASTCTVTVSKTGGATVNLASNTAALTVPPSVNVDATSTTATFAATAGNITANQTAAVSALLTGSSEAATINLLSAQNRITSLACLPNTRLSGILDCTTQLTQAPTGAGITVTLQSDSSRLQMPGPVPVGGGQQTAIFQVRVVPSDQDAQLSLTASIPGASHTSTISVTGTRPTALNFSANTFNAGSMLTGEIRMSSSNVKDTVVLKVTSNSPDVLVPSSVIIKPGTTRVTFVAIASMRAKQQNAQVSVSFGQTTVQTALNVLPSKVPVLSVPHEVLTRYGEETSFTVSAYDPQLQPVVYSVNGLPPGARFDDATGTFSWTPDPSQQGSYDVVFTATNADQSSSARPVSIVVGSGRPAITGIANAASAASPVCNPGSLASIRGRWLTPGGSTASDPTASAKELAGSRVKVNGDYAAVVFASPERVDFVCPPPGSGTALAIAVETSSGASDPLSAAMVPLAPGLFTLDGSGTEQGMVYLADSDDPELAIARDYQELGQPAQPGDLLAIRATGIGAPDGLRPIVMLGGFSAEIISVQALPDMAGVSEITIRVPPGVAEGNVELMVVYRDPAAGGRIMHHPSKTGIRSNTVTIAVEWPQ